MRSQIRKKVSRVAFAMLVLAVQITVAGHLDFDGHSQEAQCAICVSVSSLDAANVSEHHLFVANVTTETYSLEPQTFIAARFSGHHHARAPPVAS
ncbi:MAG: hypothetical protein ACR2QQ_14210 [Gammaproteobacteria bacterium]